MVKTYAQLLADAQNCLQPKEGQEYARMLARELVCFACEMEYGQFLLKKEELATEEQIHAVEEGVARLQRDEPLAYILKEWDFYGLNLYVDENVLIPRDDTCALAELAMDKTLYPEQNPRILDICTGSGCIGLAIADRIKDARVTLADISEQAVRVAKKNIARLKMGGRVCALQADALRPAADFLGKFHMIVSNPPYITSEEMETLPASVANYEPHLALHGGEDGLIFYRAIVENFTPALRPGGYMAFEFGEGQGDDVCSILEKNGYTILKRVRDFNDTERACLARYDRKER